MKTYSIISHTHWDREWYIPFENFRIRLVEMMDRLLSLMEEDRKFRFHLDAQTIVLRDYLEIRPEKEYQIKSLVKEGRLLIGPWYVQNDLHLTSGEATVRNLLLGKKISESFGGRMNIGYTADQFGLISQLPQILTGFGLDSCVFGRGYKRGERQFYWQSEDGSTLLCEHMTNWYNSLERLPENPEDALLFIREKSDKCFENNKGSSSLLMNGCDHLDAQDNLTEIIDKVTPLLSPDEKLLQDTLPEYVDRLKKDIEDNGLTLTTYKGEMRDGGQGTVLTGTASARVYLKQDNVRCQTALEGKFEPQYTALSLLGASDYPYDWSKYLWKLLIENHPHDSICGCSIDAVHRHMRDRTERFTECISDLQSRADSEYIKHIDRSTLDRNDIIILATNNSIREYKGIITAVVDIEAECDKGSLEIYDSRRNALDFELKDVIYGYEKARLSPIDVPDYVSVNRYTLLIKTKLKPMSRTVLICKNIEGELKPTESKRRSARVLENEFIKVKINSNGSFDILDKKESKLYKNQLIIEDMGDMGDLYQFIPNGEPTYTSEEAKSKVELVKDTPFEKVRKISYKLKITRSGEEKYIPFEITLRLMHLSRRLDISIKLNNTLKNHRIRALFDTGIISDTNYAGQPFDVVKRKADSDFDNDKCHPNTSFVTLEDKQNGYAILNEGLYEYEHKRESGTLAITLLGTSGFIGDWMRECDTPEGQCLGEHMLNLAILLYSEGYVKAGVVSEADRFINPPYTSVQHYDYNKFLSKKITKQFPIHKCANYPRLENADTVIEREVSLVKLYESIEGAMSLTALKGAENKKGYIVRLYNTTGENVDFTLTLRGAKRAYKARLDEEIVEALKISRGKISLTAKPKEIITVYFEK